MGRPRKYDSPARNRAVRVPDEIWHPAVRIARARRETVSERVVAALAAYVARYRDDDPERS